MSDCFGERSRSRGRSPLAAALGNRSLARRCPDRSYDRKWPTPGAVATLLAGPLPIDQCRQSLGADLAKKDCRSGGQSNAGPMYAPIGLQELLQELYREELKGLRPGAACGLFSILLLPLNMRAGGRSKASSPLLFQALVSFLVTVCQLSTNGRHTRISR
jgi:hypothetical protein